MPVGAHPYGRSLGGRQRAFDSARATGVAGRSIRPCLAARLERKAFLCPDSLLEIIDLQECSQPVTDFWWP